MKTRHVLTPQFKNEEAGEKHIKQMVIFLRVPGEGKSMVIWAEGGPGNGERAGKVLRLIRVNA